MSRKRTYTASKNRVTSHDVARRAGVSQSAVSRTFRDGSSISDEMRQKVLRAARELDYRPNAIARGLRIQRSNMVAVIMLRQTNLDYPDSLVEIMSCLTAAGLRALVFPMESFDEYDSVIEEILRYQVDGVIMSRSLSLKQRRAFDDSGVPVIFYGCTPTERASNAVDCNNDEATTWIVDKLVSLGHRRFGVLCGSPSNPVAASRAAMTIDKLRQHGMTDICSATSEYRYEEERASCREILAQMQARPTALIAVQDRLAIAAIDESRATFDISIPGQLSIIGFDGVRVAGLEPYNLTTVRLPRRRMAEAAVQMLLDRIEQPDALPELRVFPVVPVVGSTVAPPPEENL